MLTFDFFLRTPVEGTPRGATPLGQVAVYTLLLHLITVDACSFLQL